MRCDAPPSLSHSGLNSERPLVFDLQVQRSLPLPLPHAHKPTITFQSSSLVFEWTPCVCHVSPRGCDQRTIDRQRRFSISFDLFSASAFWLHTPFRCGGRTKRATRSKSCAGTRANADGDANVRGTYNSTSVVLRSLSSSCARFNLERGDLNSSLPG